MKLTTHWRPHWKAAVDKAIERAHETGHRYSVVRGGIGWLAQPTDGRSALHRATR